ncbi:unnamed protein product [Moneuplotes crassus]|uniref:Uncharacterized protein n=1 Tax=Euplotes crassus TaxID=5936 RepID=A0AAD1XIB1_EUPCR|nr:unnamed protein product [Moneuplotes crassus]
MHDKTDLLIGCFISLVSSVIATLGYAIQKMGHVKAIGQKENYLKEPLWIAGFGLIILSTPIYSFSLVFASQTAMSMVPTFSILFVMFWSWLLLNEKLTKYEVLAILFLGPGTFIIILSCNVEEPEIKSNAFQDYIFSNQSLLFLSILGALFILGGALSMHIVKSHAKMDKEIEQTTAEDKDDEICSVASSNISLEEVLNYRWNLVPMLYFPWFAGLFCCLASTMTKSWFLFLEERMPMHLNIFDKFGDPQGMFLLLNICFFTFLSFYLLNKALYYFEPIYVLPFEKVSLLINNLLCGGIILDEFTKISLNQVIGFIIGTILCIIGVLIFLKKKDESIQMKDFIKEEINEYRKCKMKEEMGKVIKTVK